MTEQDKEKLAYVEEWTKAVKGYGGFGKWKVLLVSNLTELS